MLGTCPPAHCLVPRCPCCALQALNITLRGCATPPLDTASMNESREHVFWFGSLHPWWCGAESLLYRLLPNHKLGLCSQRACSILGRLLVEQKP